MANFEEEFWAPTTSTSFNQGVQLSGPTRITSSFYYGNKQVIGERDSFFDGNILVAAIHLILTVAISVISLGTLAPFMINMTVKYLITHTVLDGERLKWDGKMTKWIVFDLVNIPLFVVSLGSWMIFFPYVLFNSIVKKVTFGAEEEESYFEGSFFTYLLYVFLYTPLCMITLGFAIPWVITSYIKYFMINTHIDGRKLMFNATGFDTALTLLRIAFLTIITAGIYSAWGLVDMYRYIAVNTTFAYEQD